MAHSLEVRVPYLDHILVDHAFSLPDETKIGIIDKKAKLQGATYRETGQKRILVDIGKELLPDNMDRQSKKGFGMPFDYWLRGPLYEVMEETLSNKSTIERGFFNPNEVNLVKREFVKGKRSWVFPWLLMITELWCREVLDKAA